jgi:hypothetical protein
MGDELQDPKDALEGHDPAAEEALAAKADKAEAKAEKAEAKAEAEKAEEKKAPPPVSHSGETKSHH